MLQEQAAWLEKDLEANKNAEFTFVFFHKTPYYKANRANVLLKQIFAPVFDKYHVDVGTVYYVMGRSGA